MNSYPENRSELSFQGLMKLYKTLMVAKMVNKSSCNAGDPGSIPGLGIYSGEGNGNPLQYSYLENSVDRGAWWVTVHGIAKTWT